MAADVDDLTLDEEDTNGDGISDYGSGDRDGDGEDDIYVSDLNMDGAWDIWDVDADEDGISETSEIDEDYDGTVDQVLHFDSDGNVVATETDSDRDGVVDQIAEDTDGDGLMDTFSYDTDGDGEVDEVTEVSDPYRGSGGVYGESEDQYYQYQEVNGLCGPTSAAMIISEQLGEFVSFEDVSQTVVDMGVMNAVGGGEYDGTWAQNMVDTFDAYGIDATIEHGDLSMLEGFLGEGRDVMVSIDADEIWGTGDSGTTNHFVVVTEIDEENGTVTLNDPGQEGGNSFVVPLETFVDAWADGGNEMVVTETAGADDDGYDSGADTDTDTDTGGLDVEDLEDLFDDDDANADSGFIDIFAVRPGAVILPLLLRI